MKSLITTSLLLLSSFLSSAYIYEADQDLFNLTTLTGTTNFNTGDDQLSGAFNLDFTFTLYGEDFTSARMATNGCLHFGLGTGNVNYNNYCGDYTPDPLPHTNYTLYPFYTDLIRDGGSKMLAKNFNDKAVFGWYNMKEYGRNNTDNSFEVILWPNDTFEYRYGGLNITNHDVLIGEQGSSSQTYTYLFHDECNTGTTNVAGTCVNTNWNGTASNTLLENGGSLYGEGSGNSIDCSDPLNNSSCAGYAAAYLTQQCGIDSLHSESCPLYWEAYDDLQCDLDPQYAPFCAGYTQENSVAYYIEDEFDYGYEEDTHFGYEEYEEEYYSWEPIEEEYFTYEEELFFFEPLHDETVYQEEYLISFEEEMFIVEEYDLVLLEEFEEELIIFEEEYIDVLTIAEEFHELPDIYELPFNEPLLMFEEFERREIILEEDHFEEEIFLEFETIEELEEWFEEEEEIEEEIEEEAEEIEEEVEETVVAEEEKGGITSQMLSVVASTIEVATNSVSGTTAGTSIHSTGNTKASGSGVGVGTTSTAVTSSVTGGQSMSNSPSISAQVVSSAMQTQQVLSSFTADNNISGTGDSQSTSGDISSTTQNTTTASTNTTATTETTTNSNVANNTISNDSGAVGETTGPKNTAVAFENNMQDQQEQLEQQQEETGEYADSTQLVAYMGTVPGFDAYRQIAMPQASAWYEPKDIYMSALMPDNNQAFFGMYSDSLNGLKALQDLQPNL